MTSTFRQFHHGSLFIAAIGLSLMSGCRPADAPTGTSAQPPVVSSVLPSPMSASDAVQNLTINGSGFVNGSALTLTPPSSASFQPDTSLYTVDSANRISYQFNNENQVGSWGVRVTNPGNVSSNIASFNVTTETVVLPTLSTVNPSPVNASTVAEQITLTGTNFQDGAAVIFTDPAGTDAVSTAADIVSASDTVIEVRFLNRNAAGIWSVRVRNPDGRTTAPLSIEVVQVRNSKLIQPGPGATAAMVAAMTSALPGDTIEFDCGFFDLTTTLLLSDTEDVLIKGCGVDQTVLSFLNNTTSPEGILADGVRGVVIEDLTVADSHGNGVELRAVEHATLRRVRTFWSSGGGAQSANPMTAENYQNGQMHVDCTDPPSLDPDVPENQGGDTTSPDYTPSKLAGRYGVYPVKSRHILVTDVESIGASDAGIYVGQSDNAIIEKSRAAYNVFGFEIENVRGGEYRNNVSECNTGGFLIYDLDNLTRYGTRTGMYDNISRHNNTYNFSAGGIVSQIPPGSGMITLGYDRIDVINNEFRDNSTAGIIHVSYDIFPKGDRPSDMKMDFFTEGMRIRGNRFYDSGNGLQPPSSRDIEEENTARVLPALLGSKIQAACNSDTTGKCPTDETGGFRGGHIVFDGLSDEYNATCPYPVDSNGQPVPAEADGKPIHDNTHPNPSCHYNAYKFDTTVEPPKRKQPEYWFSCIDNDNHFENDSVHFANFHGTKGANAALTLSSGGTPSQAELEELEEFPADFDLSQHNCVARFGRNLDPIPRIEIPAFVPSGDFDPEPTPEEVAALCEVELTPGAVNFDAAPVNCTDLKHYNLFADPQDPRSAPNSDGVPFVMNSKLFSDYSLKYRVAFLPPGTKATYLDGGGNDANTRITFPLGTIIAKTFAFNNGGDEQAVETRLLIKRTTRSGLIKWFGTTYIWQDDGNGGRKAVLNNSGATKAVSWDFTDPETGTQHTGSTPNYLIPNANQCKSCHQALDDEAGTLPIGTKIRNMNRPYRSESTASTAQASHPSAGLNQIKYWCDNGILAGCPETITVDANSQVATNLERNPKFNVPGDSGFAAGSPEDVEARARAWLEVNCQHCHNDKGFAANTGFYLDVFRPVNTSYGICKGPTATGAEGSGGRAVDIHPGDASKSILEFRISPSATSSAARMPPLARSKVDIEGHALIQNWINNVVTADEEKYPNSTTCTQ